MRISDWSSDVCSSDLLLSTLSPRRALAAAHRYEHVASWLSMYCALLVTHLRFKVLEAAQLRLKSYRKQVSLCHMFLQVRRANSDPPVRHILLDRYQAWVEGWQLRFEWCQCRSRRFSNPVYRHDLLQAVTPNAPP